MSWNQDVDAEATVRYSFDDDEWLETPAISARAGTNEALIVGIPYDTDARWKVVLDTGDEAEGDPITTAAVPDGLPLGTVDIADADRWLASGRYLLTSINEDNGGWTGGTYWTFIIDRQGRVVWANETPEHHWTLFAQVAQSGDHILWDEATYWSDWDGGAGSKVHRTWLDEEIDTIDTPGLHHAFVQLPNGNLVWGSQDHGGGEALVEKALDASDETVLWTCRDDWPRSGDCESNGLFYNEPTDTFLYSFYTNDAIVEVDHATGESLWWAGGVRNGYSFDPDDSQYSWQHGISYTDAGTLLVSTYARNDSGSTTMLREYEVDHDAGVLHQVWSYDPDIYADTNGDAWRLDNGNTLHVVGSGSELYEVTADGDMVWHVDFHGTRLLGRGQYIEDLYALVKPRE